MQSKGPIKIEWLSVIPITAFCVSLFCFGLGSWQYMMELLNVNLTACLILAFFSLFFILRNKPKIIDHIIHTNLFLSLIVILVGITQLFDIIPSPGNFSFTGTFNTLTQYAMLLSFVFPICLLYSFRLKGNNKALFYSISVIIVIMTLLSKCRSAMIAEVSAFIIILFSERQTLRTKIIKQTKKWLPFIIVLILAVIYLLYRFKSDSVNGRVLMWLISFEMFLDKPIFGFGPKGFETDYMLYQADYFIANPDSPFSQLADNISHPYNEFIKISVCFGVFGILILLSLIYVIMRLAISNKSIRRSYLLSSLATLFVWCMFSFPLDIPFIWVLSVSWFLILIEGINFEEPILKLSKILSPVCLLLLAFCVYNSIYLIQWKKIERLSLRGQTEAMLPAYSVLYPRLHNNGYFLYNYGAELHYIKRYDESQKIMLECEHLQNDYNIQMIMADNYRHLNMIHNAVECYELASAMIPCRYLPLYDQMNMFLESGDTISAVALAEKIVNKKVKVQSAYLDKIITGANALLNK